MFGSGANINHPFKMDLADCITPWDLLRVIEVGSSSTHTRLPSSQGVQQPALPTPCQRSRSLGPSLDVSANHSNGSFDVKSGQHTWTTEYPTPAPTPESINSPAFPAVRLDYTCMGQGQTHAAHT